MAFEFRRVAAALLVAALPAVLVSCSPAARDPSINAGANRAEVYPDITAIYGARLTALSKRRSSGAISDAEYRRQLAELQALREGHGKATLAEIEGQK